MQLLLDAARQLPVFLVEIFGVADDGVIDMRHMRAQLMRPPGHRLQRHPGEFLRRGFHHRVVRHRMAGALVAVLGDAHDGVFLVLFLGEIGRDAALLRLRHAGNQRPVDFSRRAFAERARELGGGEARLGDQQTARGILVEPMHQARLLALGVAHHFQHAVDMAHGAGAALHGEAGRLVQHHHVGVLEQDHLLEGVERLLRGFGEHAAANLRRVELERRNADGLALFQPVL